MPNPGDGTGDSNNRAIALAASIGGGESVVYYFDTVKERLLVYQYTGRISSSDRPLRERDDGGLRLLAARHIDFDLKLERYRDLSQHTRGQLKEAFDKGLAKQAKKSGKGMPDKKVKVGGGSSRLIPPRDVRGACPTPAVSPAGRAARCPGPDHGPRPRRAPRGRLLGSPPSPTRPVAGPATSARPSLTGTEPSRRGRA